MEELYDVLIIGSGFAGLSSALEFKKKNLSYKILEARNVIGGRVFNTQTKNGVLVELGGQWLGPLHTKALEYVKKYNLELYNTPVKNSHHKYFTDSTFKTDTLPDEIYQVFKEINKLAKELDLKKPYQHKNAVEWDNITLSDWLSANLKDQKIIDVAGRCIACNFLSVSADETSFLTALFYIASNNSIEYLLDFDDGAQNYRLVGGTANLAQNMAKEVGLKNINLNEHVLKIIFDSSKANYEIKSNQATYFAKHVVIAISPRVIKDIEFEPSLPIEYKNLFDGYEIGKAYKWHLEYDNYWFTENDWSGYFFKNSGLITEVTDNTPPNAKKYIYTGFIYGTAKDELYQNYPTIEKRTELIVHELEQIFGSEAAKYNEFIEYDWSLQEFQGGCFVARPGLNKWIENGSTWQKPFNNIHFAGSEMSDEFNGYIEGAIRSGIRVSNEILNK